MKYFIDLDEDKRFYIKAFGPKERKKKLTKKKERENKRRAPSLNI